MFIDEGEKVCPLIKSPEGEVHHPLEEVVRLQGGVESDPLPPQLALELLVTQHQLLPVDVGEVRCGHVLDHLLPFHV